MCSGTYDDAYKEEKRLLNDLFLKKENQLLTGKMTNYFHKNKPKPFHSVRKQKLLLPSVKEKARHEESYYKLV